MIPPLGNFRVPVHVGYQGRPNTPVRGGEATPLAPVTVGNAEENPGRCTTSDDDGDDEDDGDIKRLSDTDHSSDDENVFEDVSNVPISPSKRIQIAEVEETRKRRLLMQVFQRAATPAEKLAFIGESAQPPAPKRRKPSAKELRFMRF